MDIKKITKKVIIKKRFYIALFVFVIAIVISRLWISDIDVERNEDIEKSIESELNKDLEYKDNYTMADEFKYEKEDSVETRTDFKDNISAKDKVVQKSEAKKKEEHRDQSMVLPVNGKISVGYVKDKLIYSETLEQWTTHEGIDIQSEEGIPVRAALDGQIEDIKNTNEMGTVITIDHGNELITKYAYLSTDKMVKLGTKVKKGQVISGVGKAMGFEMHQGPHIHFEVIKDGNSVDPAKYLPIVKK